MDLQVQHRIRVELPVTVCEQCPNPGVVETRKLDRTDVRQEDISVPVDGALTPDDTDLLSSRSEQLDGDPISRTDGIGLVSLCRNAASPEKGEADEYQ